MNTDEHRLGKNLSVFICVHLWLFSCLLAGEAIPDPKRGLYAIWSKPEISDALEFIKGDQVRLFWGDVEPARGRYDFSSFRQQMERVAKLGRATTVQLNANRHPAYL